MANDNVSLETVSVAGASIATDQKSGGSEHYQKIKIAFGADDTFTDVVSTATTPFPVALSDTDNAILVTIDGVLDTINAKLVTGTVIGDVNLGATDAAALAAIQTAVEGTLTVASHAVTGPLTDTEIRATALPVTDNSILADDAAFTLTTSSVSVAGAIRDDALGTLTAVEGDAVPLRVNSTGALHVTGGGGGTEYNVDDAAPTVVTMAGVVRDDTLTTLTEVDGDATLLRVSSTGALHVTGGGGGTEYTEDVATANPIVGTATLMERDDALTAVTPVEGDWIGLRGSAEGALWTQDFNSDAILADTTAIKTAVEGTLTVGSHAVTGPLTDTELRATPVPVSLTGVATAANQLPDGHNVTVDNASIAVTHAALTELGTVITADDDDFVAGTTPGISAQGVYESSPTEVTDGDLGTIGITNNREVKAVISSGTVTAVTELTQMNGNAITLNNGAADAGTQRVTLANDSTGQVALAAGTSLAGDVGLSGARTSGGTTLYKNIDVDESEDEIKGTGGQVYWIHAMNMSATTKFLKIYNATAATVVVGTTVPDLTFPLATQGDTNGAGFTLSIPNGIAFSTAITIAATTGVADADSGAPDANEVIVNLGYA